VAANDPCDYTTTDPALIDVQPEGESAATGCIVFQPFRAEYNVSGLNLAGLPLEEVRRRLEMKRQQWRSAILALEVYNSALVSANPSLRDSATDVTANIIGADAVGALAAVESGLAARLGNGTGMIHLPVGLFTLLANGGGFKITDGEWQTPAGNVVVADAGYPGGAPTDGAVTAGQPWIYGSGPIYFDSTGVVENGEAWQRYNYVEDIHNLYFDEHFVVAFEPCAVVAAQVPT
jgi:hypothetical protein